MSNNKYTKSEAGKGVFLYSAKESRFKNERISACIFLPLKKETAAEYALLSRMLTRSCKKYPDFTVLSKKLASLYGAGLSGYTMKLGETQCIVISSSGLSENYTLDGENVITELSELLCSVIFNPNVIGEAFDENELEQERRQLLEYVDSEFNDKRKHSYNRAIEIMCADEDFGVKSYGDAESIKAITPKSLYKVWQTMLKTAVFNFTFTGKRLPEETEKIIAENFAKIKREPITPYTKIIKDVSAQKEKTEKMDINQAKLIMGFRAGVAEPLDDTAAMRLMTVILGGGANSKLFMNVREKLSLCYYCFARYDRTKGLVFIESGVESENIGKTKKAILKEISDMQNGEISDFEIESAKLFITNSFTQSNDTASGVESWLVGQLLDKEILSIESLTEKICAVTKEEVIEAAKKIKSDTTYVLAN